MKSSIACAVAGAVALAGAAHAQVTQSYSYDGNGRLVGVSTSGSGGTNTSAYTYDAANNRVQRVRSGTSTYAALSRLPSGALLSPFEALVSPDGRFTFAMRSTGRLELWRGDDPLWSLDDLADTPQVVTSDAGALLALESTPESGMAVWSVTNGGALVAKTSVSDVTVWSSTTGMQ
jgi:YD repeat-containing protein